MASQIIFIDFLSSVYGFLLLNHSLQNTYRNRRKTCDVQEKCKKTIHVCWLWASSVWKRFRSRIYQTNSLNLQSRFTFPFVIGLSGLSFELKKKRKWKLKRKIEGKISSFLDDTTTSGLGFLFYLLLFFLLFSDSDLSFPPIRSSDATQRVSNSDLYFSHGYS